MHDAIGHVLLGHVDIDERQALFAIQVDDGAANLRQPREGQRPVQIGGESLQERLVKQRQSIRRDALVRPARALARGSAARSRCGRRRRIEH